MTDFNVIFDELLVALSAFSLALGISGVLGIALFVLKGLGLYRMAKGIGMSNSWLAFIPVANIYVLGSISQKYVKRDGTKSAKMGVILLLLYIAELILAIALLIFFVISVVAIISNAELAIETESQMTMEMFSSFIPVIALYFVLLAVAISYAVTFFVALWRIYSLYDGKNATVYLVLSILFGAITPVFLFVISKHTPVFEKTAIDLFEAEKVEEL